MNRLWCDWDFLTNFKLNACMIANATVDIFYTIDNCFYVAICIKIAQMLKITLQFKCHDPLYTIHTMTELTEKIVMLDAESKIIYIPCFVSKTLSKHLMEEFGELDNLTHGVYDIKDKKTGTIRKVSTPRLLWAQRDEDDDITDVYSVTGSSEWTRYIHKLKRRVEKHIGLKLRYAQLNYYRNGNDYIGPHSDKEIPPGGIVASISLGTCRQIVFENDEGIKHKLLMENGSLLIMDESSAKLNWKHSVPKVPRQSRGRFNITFRS